jgi:hypothetical protein
MSDRRRGEGVEEKGNTMAGQATSIKLDVVD